MCEARIVVVGGTILYDDDEDETHFISMPFLGQLSFREVRIVIIQR